MARIVTIRVMDFFQLIQEVGNVGGRSRSSLVFWAPEVGDGLLNGPVGQKRILYNLIHRGKRAKVKSKVKGKTVGFAHAHQGDNPPGPLYVTVTDIWQLTSGN